MISTAVRYFTIIMADAINQSEFITHRVAAYFYCHSFEGSDCTYTTLFLNQYSTPNTVYFYYIYLSVGKLVFHLTHILNVVKYIQY